MTLKICPYEKVLRERIISILQIMIKSPKLTTVMRIYHVFYLSRFGTTRKCNCKPMTTSDSEGGQRLKIASRLLTGMSRPGFIQGDSTGG